MQGSTENKEKKTGRNFWVITSIVIVVFGTLLHFTYEWSGGNTIVGLFSAVNESVWEHMKLLFTPCLLIAIVQSYLFKRNNAEIKSYIFSQFAGMFCAMLFLIAFFYTYTGVFGTPEILAVDIVSFILAAILSQGLTVFWTNCSCFEKRGLQVLGIVLWGVMFIIMIWWTLAPPKLPLFT